MYLLPAIIIGVLITAPTGLAILICSRGNAANRREICRLTEENKRLEQQHRTDLQSEMAIYADHEREIADLKARHRAELTQMSNAQNGEFVRGIEWERKRPQREAAAERYEQRRRAEEAELARQWAA